MHSSRLISNRQVSSRKTLRRWMSSLTTVVPIAAVAIQAASGIAVVAVIKCARQSVHHPSVKHRAEESLLRTANGSVSPLSVQWSAQRPHVSMEHAPSAGQFAAHLSVMRIVRSPTPVRASVLIPSAHGIACLARNAKSPSVLWIARTRRSATSTQTSMHARTRQSSLTRGSSCGVWPASTPVCSSEVAHQLHLEPLHRHRRYQGQRQGRRQGRRQFLHQATAPTVHLVARLHEVHGGAS